MAKRKMLLSVTLLAALAAILLIFLTVHIRALQIASEFNAKLHQGDYKAAISLALRSHRPNIRGDYGLTPLMEAMARNDVQDADLLLKQGADINARGESGRTALDSAIIRRSIPVVRFLVSRKADITDKDNKGRTSLILAAEVRLPEAVKILLDAGANINAQDAQGNTVIMRAMGPQQEFETDGSDKEGLEVISILLARGADLNMKNARGETSLSWVRQGFPNSQAVAALLKKAGVK